MCFLSLSTGAQAGLIKYITVGKYQTWVNDNTHQGETSVGDRGSMYQNAFPALGGWNPNVAIQFSGWYMGTKDWTDANGDVWPVKLTGAAPVSVNEETVTMPVLDEDGFYIRRYMAYEPPKIVVDGFEVQDPWPLIGDEVNPDIIPGTADIMVTSRINTDMGVTIEQKVLGWSQANHDDYIIYDWTFTNTGNIDPDEEIELPDQTLEGVYFLRSSRLERWDSRFWYSTLGDYTTDTLRLHYAYPGRRPETGDIDRTGDRPDGQSEPGWLWNPMSVGQAVLHVDRSVDDPTDDFNQPMMTATENSDLLWIRNDPSATGPADWDMVYRVMTEGWEWRGFISPLTGASVRPGFRHVHMEDQAVPGVRFIDDLSWVTFGAAYFWAAGPYTMKPGDSDRKSVV